MNVLHRRNLLPLFLLTTLTLTGIGISSTAFAGDDDEWSIGMSLGVDVSVRAKVPRGAAPEREKLNWYIGASLGGGFMDPYLTSKYGGSYEPGIGPLAIPGIEFGFAISPSFYIRTIVDGKFAFGNWFIKEKDKKYFVFGGDALVMGELVTSKDFTLAAGPGFSLGMSGFQEPARPSDIGKMRPAFEGYFFSVKGAVELGHVGHVADTWNLGIRVGYAFEYMMNLSVPEQDNAKINVFYTKLCVNWWM